MLTCGVLIFRDHPVVMMQATGLWVVPVFRWSTDDQGHSIAAAEREEQSLGEEMTFIMQSWSRQCLFQRYIPVRVHKEVPLWLLAFLWFQKWKKRKKERKKEGKKKRRKERKKERKERRKGKPCGRASVKEISGERQTIRLWKLERPQRYPCGTFKLLL